MRSICTLIVGLILLSVGCNNNNNLVKREYLPLDELKKDKKFLGYEIAIGPGLVEPWAPGDKKEDRKVNTEPMEMTGPFMITDDIVGGVIQNESGKGIYGNYLHRLVMIDGKCYEFRIDENADGYGYRLVSVRNKEGELGIFFLKSKTRKKNDDVAAAGGKSKKGKSKKGKSQKGKASEGDAKKDDAKEAEAKKDDAKEAEAKKDDAKEAEAKKDDAKEAEAKKDDAKEAEAKKDDAKEAEAKKDDAKEAEAKKDDAKEAEAKKDEGQSDSDNG